MAAMERTGTTELGIKKEGFELNLKRNNEKNNPHIHPSIEFPEDEYGKLEGGFQEKTPTIAFTGKDQQPLPSNDKSIPEDTSSLYVTSPMVGTFYSSPSPEEPPFVKVGDRIDKNTVICIVEAMKVMNEVKSGVTGVVAEVLIENAILLNLVPNYSE